MAQKPITCLLTGFDAFGSNKVNPTELIVQAFPDILKTKPRGTSSRAKEIHIRKLILPTEGVKGWKNLKSALDHMDGPLLVIMTGLASKREQISLERFAMNIKDYRIPDNSGAQPLDKPISKGGAPLLRTDLDLPALTRAVQASGYPCEISNHAGTFICNELYFRALDYAKSRKEMAIVFVHVPEAKMFVRSALKSKKKAIANAASEAKSQPKQIAVLSQAVSEIVENAACLI